MAILVWCVGVPVGAIIGYEVGILLAKGAIAVLERIGVL